MPVLYSSTSNSTPFKRIVSLSLSTLIILKLILAPIFLWYNSTILTLLVTGSILTFIFSSEFSLSTFKNPVDSSFINVKVFSWALTI